jgi:hypothetical protein
MGEFFRGWRRKAGCITLVLACLVMYPWVRSLRYFDAYHIPVGSTTSVCIMSVAGSATVNCDVHEEGDNEASEQHYKLSDFNAQIYDWFDGFSQFGNFMKVFRLKWRWSGFGMGTCLDGPHLHSLVAIPYWSIILPLTGISAWLLLTKPRKPTQKAVEPSATVGA